MTILREECRAREVKMFVCGRRTPSSSSGLGTNAAITAWRADGESDYESTTQCKHHRWCLTAEQLAQYHLGVRSIGPSLVIALLMDGPQLVKRWSSRYATVLADDPGSSVLTVTSLGMAERTLSPDGKRSRVVALWKDPSTGPQEIELEPDAAGVVLGLSPRRRPEFSADSRDGAGERRLSLALGSVVQVRP